jgi:hypothetical protein
MIHPGARADGRDDRATDRDDTADRRDEAARDRDDAAQQRDIDAEKRFATAQVDAEDLADRLQGLSLQILQRLARIEDSALEPADWSDLPPTALARLDALVAEQRALARLDRQALHALLDDLHDAVGELQRDHQAMSRDRRASGGDRHHALGNRGDSGQDRRDAQADRNQAAIDREQVDPRDLPTPTTRADPGPASPRTSEPLAAGGHGTSPSRDSGSLRAAATSAASAVVEPSHPARTILRPLRRGSD